MKLVERADGFSFVIDDIPKSDPLVLHTTEAELINLRNVLIERFPREPVEASTPPIDWAGERWEIAKACMAALISSEATIAADAQIAIEAADELIARYRDGNEGGA